MGEERRVVEVLGVMGAFPHTGLALDAGPRHLRHVLRIDGPHGAGPGADAAVTALAQVRFWLGL